MGGVRQFAKDGAERVLVATQIPRVLRHLRKDHVAVLAYHNIVPRGGPFAGDRSLHLAQESFSRQLDLLCETHTIVTLDALLEPLYENERPRAVITFDDAYVGAMTAGVEELSKRGLPATVFVSPGCLGQDAFWWDQLADPETGVVPPEVRHHAFAVLEGRHSKIVAWAQEARLPLRAMPDHATPASIETLAQVAEGAQLTVESHAWSHPSLPTLTESDLRWEMERSREWLREHRGFAGEWIAYPYGHYTRTVSEAAAQCYTGGFLVAGGLTKPSAIGITRYQLSRVNIPSGLSLGGFQLRLAGIL